MSKKNNKEAKQLRRADLLKKRDKFNNPCPRPETEYLKHFGYVPNEPFFHNSAVAWDTPDMKLCLRTKQQLIDYVKEGKVEGVITRSGKEVVHLSLFKTGENYSRANGFMNIKGKGKAYYMVRHANTLSVINGEQKSSDWSVYNPFYNTVNTYCVPLDELENVLTDEEPTDEERIAIGKMDEAVQALTEEELDRLLASAKEANLREFYEYENGELIIDIFTTPNGTPLYQPRKKDKTWLACVRVLPFMVEQDAIIVPSPQMTQNIYNGKNTKVNTPHKN